MSAIENRVLDDDVPVNTRIWLLGTVERVGNQEAVDLLARHANSPSASLRNQAVLSLWRIAREPDAPHPAEDVVRDRVMQELALLDNYAAIEVYAQGKGPRADFFNAELEALRLQTETRTFRLLGFLYPRASMYRAYLHYRSPVRRTRSNAIELLDQAITDPQLKAFVALVERAEDTSGALRPRSGAYHVISTDEVMHNILREGEPWLARVWRWATHVHSLTPGGTMSDDPLDRVFVLKGIPLFAGLSGEQLLPVADIVSEVSFERGDVVFEEGQTGHHLYLIQSGKVEVLRGGECKAVLGDKECFGEMALLDESTRSATIRVVEDARLLAIARDDFQDLLDLHPPLARGIIAVLTRRLRAANEG
jgi:hypothetical protein